MITGNESAMPFVAGDQSNPDDRAICEGLTILQYFSGLAMQANADNDMTPQHIAKRSVRLAYALIKELNKNPAVTGLNDITTKT